MEQFLIEHGFKPNKDDSNIYEAALTADEACYLADGLGIDSEYVYDNMIVQVDISQETALVYLDGDIYEDVELSELADALEGV